MIEHLKKSKGGFTLVELIVVIAILAILSGIAVPVYSGYISKANEAGDLQLLGALNTAYTAACAEMGLDPTKVDAGVVWTDNKVTGLSPDALNSSFLLFYGENVNTPFKTFTSIGYDKDSGLFVGNGGTIYMSYLRADGQTVTLALNAKDVEAFKESTFAGENITAAELMEEVQKVAQQAAGVVNANHIRALELEMGGEVVYRDADGNIVTSLDWGNEYNALYNAFLNAHEGEYSDEESLRSAAAQYAYANMTITENVENGGYTAWLKSLGMSDSDIAEMTDQQKANSLVLLAARGAKCLSAEAILSALNPTSGSLSLIELNDDMLNTVTKQTIPYALAVAYVNSDYAKNQLIGKTDGKNLSFKKTNSTNEEWNFATQVATWINDGLTTEQINSRIAMEYPSYAGNYSSITATGSGRTLKVQLIEDPNPGTDVKQYFTTKSGSMTGLADEQALVNIIMQSEGFQSYYQSSQAFSDVEGFLAAMNMINDNAAGVGWEELLNQGYNSDTLKGIVSTLVGEEYNP